MKKLITLITTLAVAATFGGAAAAYAEDGGTAITLTEQVTTAGTAEGLVYPGFVAKFEEEIDCYAVNGDGDTFAIANGSTLYIFSGVTFSDYKYSGTLEESYNVGFTIADLAYDGDTLYLSGTNNTYYLFSDDDPEKPISGNYSNKFYEESINLNGYYYFISSEDGYLYITNGPDKDYIEGTGTYSMLKRINGVIYVIRSGKLYIVDGTPPNITVKELTFEYDDLSQGEEITIGSAAERLRTTADSAQYVTVPEGQYVTRIDLSDLNGEYFATVEENGVHTYKLTSSMTALVLCESGNAMIVACGGEAYITYSADLSSINMTTSDAPFESEQLVMVVMKAGLYSSPYISEGTKITTLEEGATVTVLYGLDSESYDMLETDFCRVSYDYGDGETVEGYVATGFLTAYTFVTPEDGDLTAEWNEDYSEANVIVNVVLILIIVVLIIAGVVYLTYFSGAGRRNKKKPDNDDGGDSDHGDYDDYGSYNDYE